MNSPDRKPEPQATPAPRRGIGFYFWGTIFILIGATLALVIVAFLPHLREPPASGTALGPEASDTALGPEASDTAPPPQISYTQEQLARLEVRAQQAGYQAVEASVDDALDQIFGPVYAGIPTYADFHYSVWGQYAELLAAGKETLGIEEEIGSLMRERLFGGFETRLVQQMAHLQAVYEYAVTSTFAAEGERLTLESGQQLPEAIQLTLDDAKQRMIVTLPAATAGSAAGAAVVVAVVKPIAAKVVASTAVKAAAKGIGKAAGIGGSAAAGATVGSFLGPVGTAAGGIGGAIVGWLVVDYAVVSLDEYFNRDEFEAELRDAINVEQQQLRARILQAYASQSLP